ncbi:NADPH-dependent oxidoreductase [Pseudomonas sp. AOB-7]|uniref:NADPH-dependent FMN reductase n=1 Tax=Pseudomonas sp. AOB-7 TaxID=2482750 RepID=UPI000EFB8043|nr:NAD(P)H-dependent oxidoreductase [Pseudomonas sp. AOB-7]RMH86724.1 NADPH-dependent oxidoreductase [Pseudomonas sp. AOB-7]
MNSKVKLVLIYEGNDEEAIGPALARWASVVIAQRAEFDCCLLDTSQQRAALGQLARADAFLILASEQSHGYSAELKAFIDQATIRWQARPVAFIGYGGESGGMNAIAQLRQVLAGQHAVPICSVVTLPNPWALLDENGSCRLSDQARIPMARMLVLLNWWAIALRSAREQKPYELVSQ